MRHLTDTHAHTVASTHAYSTVEEYFRAASDKGLQLFSITDHGPEMPDSPHPWPFWKYASITSFVMVCNASGD